MRKRDREGINIAMVKGTSPSAPSPADAETVFVEPPMANIERHGILEGLGRLRLLREHGEVTCS